MRSGRLSARADRRRQRIEARFILGAATVVALLGATLVAFAGSTGTTALFTPAGSGAVTSNGDYISASTALNAPYRYFIEVPPGLSRLVVELFDADVGAGGAGEAGSGQTGRDRARGSFNTTAAYRLFDPSGAAVTTRFSSGDASSPSGADNAWLTLYDSAGGSSYQYRDLFGARSYNNNDGTDSWSGAWTEIGDDGSPTAGDVQVIQDGGNPAYQLRVKDDSRGVYRLCNLSGALSASLSFTYRREGLDGSSDYVAVYLSSNGGATWTEIVPLRMAGAATDGSYQTVSSYDISAYIAGNTAVAFYSSGTLGNNDIVYIDNVTIAASGPPPTAPSAGHWELQVDMSSAVTGGDDVNALGIRAHDGDSGSGGTELPVYFDSHSNFGVNPPGSGTANRSYTEYSYITAGCSCYENDFDYDTDQDANGSISFTSRTGVFSQTFGAAPLSDNDDWARNTVTGWTTDAAADDYGIWTNGITIGSYVNGAGQNGNYTNFYAANSQAAANPPTANPTTSAFRVYLPTDGGAAPVKPHLAQVLAYNSGPNPPVVGQTTVVTVTVRIANPTTRPIVFSTPSNVVTANVPGGGAVYGGTPQVSQGSITSQPSVGSAGNVVWNPGTVVAGATAILSYRVNVTPTSSGQRIPVTATPTSGNGTRAQYLDETANSSQARATYLFGPLCELALTEAVITPAVITDVKAYRDAGETTFEWQTATEVAVAGFEVYRLDPLADKFLRVTERLVPGLQESPQGGVYRIADDQAPSTGELTYVVAEYEATGAVRVHGPFVVEVEQGAPDGARELRRPRAAGTTAGEVVRPRRAARARALPWPTLPKPRYVKIGVRAEGIHFLSSRVIADSLGVHPLAINAAVGTGLLVLSNRGEEIPWERAPGDSGILFWGEAVDSVYARDNVYWLRFGRGEHMQTAAVSPPSGAGSASFASTSVSETDTFAGTLVATDPDSDYWFWSYLTQGDPVNGVRQFTIQAPDRVTGGVATLRTYLHGATDTGVSGEHEVIVRLNGTQLQTVFWDGIAPYMAEATFAQTLLQDGSNQVEVEAVLPAGVPNGTVYLERFELGYQRAFKAQSGRLDFVLNPAEEAVVAGLGGSYELLLDVTDPRHPRRVEGYSKPSPGAVGLRNGLGTTRYAAAAEGGWLAPAWVRRDTGLDPMLDASGAAHVIVTTRSMMSTAQELADYRSSHGLASSVVDVESLYENYSFGIPTPHAIRDFIADLASQPGSSLGYVLLAGSGSFDYRDLLGFNDSLVPPLMTPTDAGLFAADPLFGDLVGDDGVPEVAVGRIAARTPAELAGAIDKLEAYELGAAGTWLSRALVIADDPEGGVDFGAYGDRVAGAVGGNYAAEKVYLGVVGPAAARTQTLGAFDSGLGMACFVGHGGVDRITAEGVMLESDVPGLSNAGRAPVMAALTCTMNRFEVPGFPCLGAALTNSATGGAAAVFAPSGVSDNAEATRLGEHLVRRLSSSAGSRVGDVVTAAVAGYLAEGGQVSLVRVYNQLGDPAMLLRLPGNPAGTPGGGPVE